MSKIAVGKKAPAFTLEGTLRELVARGGRGLMRGPLLLSARQHARVARKKARALARPIPQFKKLKTAIVGISPDSVSSHEKFKSKMGFPFELLSDVDRTVCKRYDVIQEKSMYGKKYMGVERSTFLIDAQGVLRAEWRKVKVNGHAEAVLAAVKAL